MTNLKKSEWPKVKFGDVVRRVNKKTDPEASGLERYVAGEHMDTDNLKISRWGTVGDGYLGPAFTSHFLPGQVLYGSRRTYLRKVAVPDFEGICANTTFVLESSTPELLPEFLPHVMSAESFHEFSISKSKGSVNPYINYSDLVDYEFVLPPVEEQNRISGILSAAEKLSDTQNGLILALEQSHSAIWADSISGFSEEVEHLKLGDLLSFEYGSALKKEDRSGGEYPVYGSSGIVGFHSDAVTPESMNIIVGRKGSAGSVELVRQRCWVIDTAYFVRLKRSDLEWEFVFELLSRANLQDRTSQTAIPGLNRDDAYGIDVSVPSQRVRSIYLEKRKKVVATWSQLHGWQDETRLLQKVVRESLLTGGVHV